MVSATFVKLAGSYIQSKKNLLSWLVARFLNCFNNQVQGLLVRLYIRCKSTFVPYAGCVTPALQNCFETVKDLHAHAQTFGKDLGSSRDDHELLRIQVIVGVGASIQNVHHGDRKDARVGAAYVTEKRLVQRSSCGPRRGHRNS